MSQLSHGLKLQTKTQKQAFFNAYSIEPLTDLLKIKKNQLSYRHAVLLFLCIGDQLNYLEKDKYSILTFNLKDIVIINSNADRNDSIFLCLNTKYFYHIKDNQIEIKYINLRFSILRIFCS